MKSKKPFKIGKNRHSQNESLLESPLDINFSPKRARVSGAFIGNELAPDRFLVEMPMHAYARCLAKCDEKSPEYVLLRNGIVLGDDPHKIMVHIRCDPDKARLVRRIVVKECPEFLDELQVYPDPASR
jgi:hypothetical protein